MKRLAIALTILISLVGCQTDTSTPSGSPEVTIPRTKADQVKTRIVNNMLNSGGRLKSETSYQLVFDRKWGGAVGAAVIGALLSTDASDAIERLTFSIAETADGTRVVLDRTMVRTGSFGRESANPANNAPGLESLQTILDRVVSPRPT